MFDTKLSCFDAVAQFLNLSFYFWQPTEKPTVEKSSAAKEPTDPPSKGKTSEVLLKTHHKDSEKMAGGIRGQGNEVDIRLSFYFYFCLSVRYGGQIDANEWFVGDTAMGIWEQF